MAVPGQLSAQFVRGQVVDSGTGMPVGSGFVVLIDSAGREVARALSTGGGRFLLEVPAAGRYQLRSERIGYRAFTSQPMDLSTVGTVDYSLRVAALPVRLATLRVEGRDRCRSNPEEGESTVLIWEEIRKALAATTWSGEQELFHYRMYKHRRDMSADRREVIQEIGSTEAGVSEPPFKSIAAEMLEEDGYIVDRSDGTWYYAPDAYVLQHASFLSTHCFHVVREERDRPGLVGLAFEPMRDRELPDVQGVLWLDEVSSELRTLEVQHTRIPERIDDERVGATVHFMMLPSGAWIVQRWEIRTPVVTIMESSRRDRLRRGYVDGFRDTGGEILEVSTRSGDLVYEAPWAKVTGTVFDSTRGDHLEGAFVSVRGTDFASHVDRTARYALDLPLEGEYAVTLSHPWLDSIAVGPLSKTVELVRGGEVQVDFAVPHVRGVLRQLCGNTAFVPQSRVTVGVVRDVRSGAPVDGATITASWQAIVQNNDRFIVSNLREEVRTDGSGFFAVCDIPAGRPVTITAEKGAAVSREAGLIFPIEEGGDLLFSWDRRPGRPYDEAYLALGRVWKIDFVLGAGSGSEETTGFGSTLDGLVTDRETGLPLDGTSVVLNGVDSTVTRDDGTFDLLDVEWVLGVNHLQFRRYGYESGAWELWLDEDDDDVSISVTLSQLAVALEEVQVGGVYTAVPAKLVGFYRRREQGRGHFLGPDELERISAVTFMDVLRRIPGITVTRPGSQFGTNEYIQFSSASAMCRSLMQQPQVYVDGTLLDVDYLISLEVRDMAAVETYNGASEMPPEYNRTGTDCGLILVWTK
jgi:hypothetical protein